MSRFDLCSKHNREKTGFTSLFCPDCVKEEETVKTVSDGQYYFPGTINNIKDDCLHILSGTYLYDSKGYVKHLIVADIRKTILFGFNKSELPFQFTIKSKQGKGFICLKKSIKLAEYYKETIRHV